MTLMEKIPFLIRKYIKNTFFALLKKQLIIIFERSEEIFLNFTLITFHFTLPKDERLCYKEM